MPTTYSKLLFCLNTFLEFSLNFLSNSVKKTLQNLVQSGRKAMGQFDLLESQFERKVIDKITCKTHLE